MMWKKRFKRPKDSVQNLVGSQDRPLDRHCRDCIREGTVQPMCFLFCAEKGQKQNILRGITRSVDYRHRIM